MQENVRGKMKSAKAKVKEKKNYIWRLEILLSYVAVNESITFNQNPSHQNNVKEHSKKLLKLIDFPLSQPHLQGQLKKTFVLPATLSTTGNKHKWVLSSFDREEWFQLFLIKRQRATESCSKSIASQKDHPRPSLSIHKHTLNVPPSHCLQKCTGSQMSWKAMRNVNTPTSSQHHQSQLRRNFHLCVSKFRCGQNSFIMNVWRGQEKCICFCRL